MRASNERLHAQAMQNQASQQGGANSATGGGVHAYQGIDRSRKQDFIDPSVLAECVKKVGKFFHSIPLSPFPLFPV